jgi:hypothetical protein
MTEKNWRESLDLNALFRKGIAVAQEALLA